MKRVLLFFTVIAFTCSLMGQGMNVMHNGNRSSYGSGGGASYPSHWDTDAVDYWEVADAYLTKTGNDVDQWDGVINSTALVEAANPPSHTGGDSIVFVSASSEELELNYTSTAQPITVHAVIKVEAWSSLTNILTLNGSSSALRDDNTSSPDIRLYAGVNLTGESNLTLNTWHLVTIVLNGASSKVQIDNQTATSGNAGTNDGFGTFRIADNAMDMKIKAIVVLTDTESGAEETASKNYLNNKYSIY